MNQHAESKQDANRRTCEVEMSEEGNDEALEQQGDGRKIEPSLFGIRCPFANLRDAPAEYTAALFRRVGGGARGFWRPNLHQAGQKPRSPPKHRFHQARRHH